MQGGTGTPRQLGGLAGSALRGAGSRMMPALDFLATNLIGDSPALTNALRHGYSSLPWKMPQNYARLSQRTVAIVYAGANGSSTQLLHELGL